MTAALEYDVPGPEGLAGVPRLLPPTGRAGGASLDAHMLRHGSLPAASAVEVLDLLERSGLTGRGGAAFPVHRKMRAVAGGPGPRVVVANGAEGEPASAKDKTLLALAPHLTLDGLQVAAHAVGASAAYLYVHRDHALMTHLRHVLDDRRRAGVDHVPVELVGAPHRFVAGEESAVANKLSGGDAAPRTKPPRVFEQGVHGRPTLVSNVETLAHVALIARYGAEWFRSVGDPEQPGTMLFTVSGASTTTRVVEAPVGATLHQVVSAAGTVDDARAVLLGGYHGTWIPLDDLWHTPLTVARLRPRGRSVGAGVVALLPGNACGLVESARVVRYLANESAGQCGPCLFGLPALADAMHAIADAGRNRRAVRAVARNAGLVERRGACHHPDGSVRFARSALEVFADELARHDRGRCTATARSQVLPVPVGIRA